MALSHEQQAIELITRSKRVLITTREHAPTDSQAAVAALFGYLKKQHKDCDAVLPGMDAAKVPSFLPHASELQQTLGAMRAFLLSLDVSHVPLSELVYDVKNGKLNITVVPKHGEWTPKDVSFKHGEDRYDLVIAIDCPDMASLGPLFRDHADFLYRTPIIAIDRDPGHEHWAQVNLVDLTAVATTEVLFGMFERWNRHHIAEDIATALLAGMIAKTQSFRSPNVTPKTLQIASQLVTLGAKREDIVHGLWRTRSVPTLKLWGRALSRLEQDREHGIVWTMIARQDFLAAGANDQALDGIVNELVGYAPEAKVIVLAYETEHADKTGACISIHAAPPLSAQELSRAFGASGSRERVDFCLAPGTSLVEGTKTIIDRLRETLKATKK